MYVYNEQFTRTRFDDTRVVEQLGESELVICSDHQPFLHTYIHRIHVASVRVGGPYAHQVEALDKKVHWSIIIPYCM